MLVPLDDAAPHTCGSKAATLGHLRRAGFRVPDGFVVPFAATDHPGDLRRELERGLARLGGGPVAVRSSASDEDTTGASAAGQYESYLGLTGVDEVLAAMHDCWASARSPRATAYRRSVGARQTRTAHMAVLVQHQIDAEASGVMFTPSTPDGPTTIEASWGLGTAVVAGTVTPDSYLVDGTGTIQRRISTKLTRVDRSGRRHVTRDVPATDRRRPSLDDDVARELANLGRHVSTLLGTAQDIEWALADGRLHLLQSRPVTATVPAAAGPVTVTPGPPARITDDVATPRLTGTPGSPGSAIGPVRVIRGPDDFRHVRSGDILVCPFTDPAWTALLGVVAAVVTETGGALSHAAIVARERGIPAVLGVSRAMERLRDARTVTVDGTAGTVTASRPTRAPVRRD